MAQEWRADGATSSPTRPVGPTRERRARHAEPLRDHHDRLVTSLIRGDGGLASLAGPATPDTLLALRRVAEDAAGSLIRRSCCLLLGLRKLALRPQAERHAHLLGKGTTISLPAARLCMAASYRAWNRCSGLMLRLSSCWRRKRLTSSSSDTSISAHVVSGMLKSNHLSVIVQIATFP
jgi:hypothetical protein